MSLNESEAKQALRQKALGDLQRLKRSHAMDSEVIDCLLASKTEARRYIAFFKRMTFLTNGSFMAGGLALIGFGCKQMIGSQLLVGFVCLFIGALVFWQSSGAFISMIRTLHAMEAVARKHDLI